MPSISAIITFCALALDALANSIPSPPTECFFSNGEPSLFDKPCVVPNGNDNDTTFCCPPSSICSSNKICILSGQPLESTCTDPTWKSPKCPNFCTKRRGGDDASIRDLTLCYTNPTQTVYCCNADHRGGGLATAACNCSATSNDDDDDELVTLKNFIPISTLTALAQSPDPATPTAPTTPCTKSYIGIPVLALDTFTDVCPNATSNTTTTSSDGPSGAAQYILILLLVAVVNVILFCMIHAAVSHYRKERTRSRVVVAAAAAAAAAAKAKGVHDDEAGFPAHP